MAKRKTSTKTTIDSSDNKPNILALLKTRQAQTILGIFLILFSAFLCIAFISFFFNWQEDQSTLTQLADKTVKSKNLLGKIGANLSHFFIYKSFGNVFLPFCSVVSGEWLCLCHFVQSSQVSGCVRTILFSRLR